MRIAIVGAGSLGSAFGAGFVRAGHDVTFIDVSAALVNALNATGLTIVDGGQRTSVAVHATTDPARVARADLVMVFVKAYHTDAAARMLAPLLGPDTVLATLQNGLGAGDVLASHHPAARIVSGVTYHAATVVKPGLVRHSVGPTFVGPHERADVSGAQILADACAEAGWPAQAMPDVAPAVWKKLLLNCTNAVAALTGMSGAAQVADAHVHRLLHDVVAEGIAIAHALGHTGIGLEACVRDMDEVLTRAGDGRASMLQDFDAGRRTEIDALNGAVVRAAERLTISVPINRALLSLVKGWERTHGFG
jgi:2-dehydropantoate 2-reductase